MFFNKKIANDTYKTYISSTREIIQAQKDIDTANSWESLPVNQKKEKLRSRWFEIIKYYTLEVPQNQKMSDDQVQSSFNSYFDWYHCRLSFFGAHSSASCGAYSIKRSN